VHKLLDSYTAVVTSSVISIAWRFIFSSASLCIRNWSMQSMLPDEAEVMCAQQGDRAEETVEDWGCGRDSPADWRSERNFVKTEVTAWEQIFDLASANTTDVWIAGIRIQKIVPNKVSAWAHRADDFRGDAFTNCRVQYRSQNRKLRNQIETGGGERKLGSIAFHEGYVGTQMAAVRQAFLKKVDSEAVFRLCAKIDETAQHASRAATYIQDGKATQGSKADAAKETEQILLTLLQIVETIEIEWAAAFFSIGKDFADSLRVGRDKGRVRSAIAIDRRLCH
jgi:hypothetical protein